MAAACAAMASISIWLHDRAVVVSDVLPLYRGWTMIRWKVRAAGLVNVGIRMTMLHVQNVVRQFLRCCGHSMQMLLHFMHELWLCCS